MTFDPTTNRIPFGLLSEDEQEALKAWSHGWEVHKGWVDEWVSALVPCWAMQSVYRGKPKPVVKSKWFNVYPASVQGSYNTRELANYNSSPRRIAVLRTDTCNGVSTAHLEGVKNDLP